MKLQILHYKQKFQLKTYLNETKLAKRECHISIQKYEPKQTTKNVSWIE